LLEKIELSQDLAASIAKLCCKKNLPEFLKLILASGKIDVASDKFKEIMYWAELNNSC
jgi:hypothetical protein